MKIGYYLLELLFVSPLQLFIVSVVCCLLFVYCIYFFWRQKNKNKTVPVDDVSTNDLSGAYAAESTLQDVEDNSNLTSAEVQNKHSAQLVVQSETEASYLFKNYLKKWLERSGYSELSQEVQNDELKVSTFRLPCEGREIGVICLWKRELIKGWVEWAKSYELVSYREFEKEQGIPVFIAVGLTGSAVDPGMLSVIPLSRIRSNVLSSTLIQEHLVDTAGIWEVHISESQTLKG